MAGEILDRISVVKFNPYKNCINNNPLLDLLLFVFVPCHVRPVENPCCHGNARSIIGSRIGCNAFF